MSLSDVCDQSTLKNGIQKIASNRPVLPSRWHPHQHSRKVAQEARSSAPHRLRVLPRDQVPREATQRDHRQVSTIMGAMF